MKKLFTFLAVLFMAVNVWGAELTSPWNSTTFGKVTDKPLQFTTNGTSWETVDLTVGAGEPALAISSSNLKYGNSKTVFWKAYTIQTDAFSDYAVTKVTINTKDNGNTESAFTIKQGDVTIGSAAGANGSTAKDVIIDGNAEGNSIGEGGILKILFTSTKQASYIYKITVEFEDLSGSTKTLV